MAIPSFRVGRIGVVVRRRHHVPAHQYHLSPVAPTSLFKVGRSGVFVRRRHHVPAHHLSRVPPTTLASRQGFTSTPPCHGVFKYFIPLLIAVIAIKFEGKSIDPFETHPANTWAFFIAMCIYYLTLGILKELQNSCASYNQILGHVILISGSLSSVSLVSIILPRLLGRLIFVLWAFLPMILVRNLLKHLYRWLNVGMKNVFSYLFKKLNKFLECFNPQQQQQLPR